MNTHFKTIISVAVTAFLFAGCGPSYVRTSSSGYYSTSYRYNYGDGQPDSYYYNTYSQTYQHQPSANVVVSQVALGFNDFYTQLSPHGTWINLRPYGQVWVANVRNFQPYSTNGYWAYTNYGWTWVSNYSWGWAPFHYGRWGHDTRYGWYWVPGYEWGPAWVAWSSSSDMYGWAPLMPGMNFNVRLSISHFPSSYWTFMPGRHMGNTNIGGYYVNRSNNVTIIKNTTIINNYGTENNRRYSMGPNASDVQRYTGRTVLPLRVSSTTDSRSTGVSNDELRVYRPSTSEGSSRSSTAPDNNSRVSTPSTRSQQDQPATRAATPSTRSQAGQATTGTTTPTTTRSQAGQAATGTRSQTGQTSTGTATPPSTRSQAGQTTTGTATPTTTRSQAGQASTGTATPTTRSQTVQSSEPEYRPTEDQPRVTNRAAPQTTRQIQRAQNDNNSSQRQQQVQQRQSSQQQDQQQTTRRSTSSSTSSSSSGRR